MPFQISEVRFVEFLEIFTEHMNILLRFRLRAFVGSVLIAPLFASLAHAADPAELFEKLSPSVWVVVAVDRNGSTLGSGSGVVIGAERMVTNCHVLKKAASMHVKRENTAHAARLEFADVDRDLCTLKVKNLSAPAVNIGALSSVRVGQKVIVIGAPRGLELTLSDGLVSALRRDQDDAVELIQISAPISPGSSGGGLFNMNGDLLGITTSSLRDSQNLNFATPSEWIKDIASRSELGEARKRAEQEKGATPRKSVVPSFKEQRLQGAEALATVKTIMGLGANDTSYKDGSAIIDVSNAAKPTIVLSSNRGSENARFAFHSDSSELCITATFPAESLFRPNAYVIARREWGYFVRCYWLYEFEPDRFVLREKDAAANAFVIEVK
jgi:serine protease Do